MCSLKSRTVHHSNTSNVPQGNVFLCGVFSQCNIGHTVSYYTLCIFELILNSHLFSSSVCKSCHRNICLFFFFFLLTSVLWLCFHMRVKERQGEEMLQHYGCAGFDSCLLLEVSSSSLCCPSCPCHNALCMGRKHFCPVYLKNFLMPVLRWI